MSLYFENRKVIVISSTLVDFEESELVCIDHCKSKFKVVQKAFFVGIYTKKVKTNTCIVHFAFDKFACWI